MSTPTITPQPSSSTLPASSDEFELDFSVTLPPDTYAEQARTMPMPFNPKGSGQHASDLRYYITEAFIKHARAICINKLCQDAYESDYLSIESETLAESAYYIQGDARDAVENLVTEGGLLYFHSGITTNEQLARIDDCAAIAAQYKRLHATAHQGAAA